MTQKPLFLQIGASDDFRGMIEDHAARHQSYCERHGYEYKAVFGDTIHEDQTAGGWFRIQAVLDAMESGDHDFIFWIDADAFVVDGNADMRLAVPEWAFIGMCVHPVPWGAEPVHFQTGCFYMRTCDEAIAFLREVLRQRGELAGRDIPVTDQCVMNALLFQQGAHWQRGLCVLQNLWNWTVGCTEIGPCVVAAFHGRYIPRVRRQFMRIWAEELPMLVTDQAPSL
jgi:galactosyl transferase GMA12/MNN10 family